MSLDEASLSFRQNLIDPIILRRMYHEQGLSLGEIARLAGTTKSHVHYYMSKFDLQRRPWTGLEPKQDPNLILSLYKDQGKTLEEISEMLGISKSTAWKHATRQIRLRPRSAPTYLRNPFSGNDLERAYLLGYRAGDLNAFQDSALTITARVSTTHQAMLETFRAAFTRYGHCIMTPRRVFLTGYDWQIKAYLDNSFRFLIPKPTEPPSETVLYVFIAGFGDSDGCWSMSNDHGRATFSFDLTSRRRDLLDNIAIALQNEGYHPHVYLSREKGTIKMVKGRDETRAITLTDDTWTLVIKRKDDVKRLARCVLPYSKHQEKIAKMKLILDTRSEWAEIGPEFERLRRQIRLETNEAIMKAEIEYKARLKEPIQGVVG